ncbi:MAG: hypothetical protein ACHQNE_00695 [Candidatus Kapaibacterium sp.]
MNGNTAPSGPQSWFDLVVMPPMDPRGIIQSVLFQNQAGASQPASFARSATFLHNSTWVNPPMIVTQPGGGTSPGFVLAANPQDFDSMVAAQNWTSLHAMTVTSAQVALSVQKLMFLKAGMKFVNNIYLDFTGGATSTDIQLSIRDNSATSGDFQGAPTGTVPVFSFPSTTYGGTGKQMQLTLLQPGRFNVGLRIIDNSGNYSIFEMDWIVLP